MMCIAVSKLYGLAVCINLLMLCAFWLVRLHEGENNGLMYDGDMTGYTLKT